MTIGGLATAGLLPLQLAACASVQSLERPHTVALPMPADVAARFDYAAGDVRAPVVLVQPILNGQKQVVWPIATDFANNGYNAVIVDTVQRKTLLEDMLEPEAAIRRTAIRHRRVQEFFDRKLDGREGHPGGEP